MATTTKPLFYNPSGRFSEAQPLGEMQITQHADKSISIAIRLQDRFKDIVNPDDLVLGYFPRPSVQVVRHYHDEDHIIRGGVDA